MSEIERLRQDIEREFRLVADQEDSKMHPLNVEIAVRAVLTSAEVGVRAALRQYENRQISKALQEEIVA